RLHGTAPWSQDHQLGAEVGENIGAGLAEAVAVGKQQDNRGYAPGHAEHGQSGAAAAIPHGSVGFGQQITQHRFNPGQIRGDYSCRSASTGGSMAALRAGYNPATTPATVKQPIARNADARTSSGGST